MLRIQRVILVVVAALLAACQEELAAPADCPNLCPGDFDIRDTVLLPIQDGDSSYDGYLRAGQGTSLRVSWQFPVSEDRAVVRFSARPDSFLVADSALPYTTDSIALELSLGYRDTLVTGLKIFLYRLPATVDSTVTFTDVDAAFIPANVVDSFMVDDSVVTRRLRVVYSTPGDLAKVDIPAADSGVLALGVQIRAASGTGVRIGSAAAGSGAPAFINYVQIPNGDTTVGRVLNPTVRFNTYVSQTVPVLDPDLLTIGGAPSARTLIRFPWPAYLRDSAQLVRATLELIPTGPLTGIPRDSVFIQVRPVVADFGSKSPTSSDALFLTTVAHIPGPMDTLAIEVRRALTLWQGDDGLPPALVVQLFPETSSFTRATFGSSRTPGMTPMLRVTYSRTFPFGEP